METRINFRRVKNCGHEDLHMLLIDIVSYLPLPLRKLPEVFGFDATKSWYPHYFNKNTNLDYVRPIPDVSYFGVEEISVTERMEFMTWYDDHKNKVFDNKLVLEKYCQDDVSLETSVPDIQTRVYRDW
jgi:hypothetical protein